VWNSKALPRFNRRRKKLAAALRRRLNDEMVKVLNDPRKGERKRGPLKAVWVERFQAENAQYLLAYETVQDDKMVVFWDIGLHENFHRDLERYIRESIRGGEP
jgi:mRNA-degrading endonuclease RelE of RelBE toxin-antitoxin system